MNYESKVGIVVFVALIIFIFLMTFTNVLKLGEKGYFIYVKYTKAADLKVGAPVLFAGGVKMGRVEEIIRSTEDVLSVKIFISKDHKIKKGAIFSIEQKGIMGDKYIDISPPIVGNKGFHQNGDIVKGTESGSLSKVVSTIGGLASNLDGLVQDNREDVRIAINNLKIATDSLKDNIGKIAKELRIVSTDIRELTSGNKDKFNNIVTKVNNASIKINKIADELNKTTDDINNIISYVRSGKGPVGMLIYDREVQKSLKTTLENVEAISDNMKKHGILYKGDD